MSQQQDTLKAQVAALPLSTGVYQFVDKNGTVIYVGKAKSLRKRVSSYFVQSRDHTPKVRVLVRQIVEIRHFVVNSEQDALLLENSLIKTLQPRYNILLKDDKTYPWIVIRREPFPRVESTRQLRHDGSQYFGPYGSVSMQHSILEFIREVIPLRTCKLNLSLQAVARGRYGVCLQYHLGNCKGPCVGAQSEAEYDELVDMVKQVLRGDLRPVRRYLERNMQEAAAALKFETAQRFKQRLDALENYQSRSVIVSAKIVDCDVFSLLEDDDVVYCNFIRLRHGSVVALHTVKLSPGVEASQAEMLTMAIQYVVDNISHDLSREVIVPLLPSTTLLFDKVVFTVPKRGEKAELLEFSLKSARIYRAEQMKNLEIKNPERHTERLMNAMQRELHLDRQPRHIECFDNSNLQGTNPVASCVVFRDGRPSRKEYRHFNIKTVVGADDFASMREIVRRRYTRLLEEGAIVGLAKRIEEIFFPGDPMPYYLSRTGEPLKVVCHIRDEAHRFGITFHRQKRSNAFIDSELEHIKGIGAKSVNELMRRFRTISKIRSATEAELAETVGTARARGVYEYFHSGAAAENDNSDSVDGKENE